jgi:hypothetical protein
MTTPHLHRRPAPRQGNGRKVLIAVAVFFVLLVGFVLVLVFAIGVHNHGAKAPPAPRNNVGAWPMTRSLPSP